MGLYVHDNVPGPLVSRDSSTRNSTRLVLLTQKANPKFVIFWTAGHDRLSIRKVGQKLLASGLEQVEPIHSRNDGRLDGSTQ